MSDDTERDEVDLRTEPEKVADDKVEALERELAALQPGVQVVIERLKPTWCKGQLEKLTVDEDGLDLDYLIQNWGGHLLSIKIIGAGGRIRGSHSVELYSFEPRRYGKRLRAPNNPDDDETSTPATNPVVVQSPSQDQKLLLKMFDMLNAQRASEVETLRLLLTQQQHQISPPVVAQKSAVGNITELVKTAQAMSQLKEIFRTDPDLADSEGAFPAQVLDVLKLFLDKKQTPSQAPVPARLTGPVHHAPNDMPASVTQLRNPDIAKRVSEMDPDTAADTIMNALGNMDREKQEKAMSAFLARFQEAALEDEEKDDDEYEVGDEIVEQ